MIEANVQEMIRRTAHTQEQLANFAAVFKQFVSLDGQVPGGLQPDQKQAMLAKATQWRDGLDTGMAAIDEAWNAETAVPPFDA